MDDPIDRLTKGNHDLGNALALVVAVIIVLAWLFGVQDPSGELFRYALGVSLTVIFGDAAYKQLKKRL